MYELHVVDRNGVIYRGVEAFQAIWQAFPNSPLYACLNSVIDFPLVNPIARLFYRCFARIRPWLPKRHSCKDGACRIDRKR
jgi:predicted DCC family thiol-disulfide oxidoreductase YuxK